MEYTELETIWKNYDERLNNLERLNKKLIMETIFKKPQRKINWAKFKELYAVIMLPAVLIFVLHPYLSTNNMDSKFIIGCILLLSTVAFVVISFIKGFMTLKNIDLSNDSVLESIKKVSKFKTYFNMRKKYIYIITPFFGAGILLVAWNAFTFDSKTILVLIGIFAFVLLSTFRKLMVQTKKIEGLEKDILEIKEYEFEN